MIISHTFPRVAPSFWPLTCTMRQDLPEERPQNYHFGASILIETGNRRKNRAGAGGQEWEWYQLFNRLIPSSISIWWCQPRAWSLEGSVSFRSVPSGFDGSKARFPLKPMISLIRKASSLIEISFPVPMLIWVLRVSRRSGDSSPYGHPPSG